MRLSEWRRWCDTMTAWHLFCDSGKAWHVCCEADTDSSLEPYPAPAGWPSSRSSLHDPRHPVSRLNPNRYPRLENQAFVCLCIPRWLDRLDQTPPRTELPHNWTCWQCRAPPSPLPPHCSLVSAWPSPLARILVWRWRDEGQSPGWTEGGGWQEKEFTQGRRKKGWRKIGGRGAVEGV